MVARIFAINWLHFKTNPFWTMEVLVFATNVKIRQQVRKVKPLLTCIAGILDWNFDLEDCDRILRIEADGLCPRHIEAILHNAGFSCRELE